MKERETKKLKINEQGTEKVANDNNDKNKENGHIQSQLHTHEVTALKEEKSPSLFCYYVELMVTQRYRDLYLSDYLLFAQVCKGTFYLAKGVIEDNFWFTPREQFKMYSPKKLQGLYGAIEKNNVPKVSNFITHAQFDSLTKIKYIPLNISYLELGKKVNNQLDLKRFTQLETLILSDIFSQGLQNKLPPSLRNLTVGSSFNSKISFPPQLHRLELRTKSIKVNQLTTLKNLTLLQELVLPDEFKEDISTFCPLTVLKLDFGDNYKKAINIETLPPLVQVLTFGQNYQHLIPSLPQSLQEITFPEEYNYEIPPLPHHLRALSLPNKEITISEWPQRLKMLKTPSLLLLLH